MPPKPWLLPPKFHVASAMPPQFPAQELVEPRRGHVKGAAGPPFDYFCLMTRQICQAALHLISPHAKPTATSLVVLFAVGTRKLAEPFQIATRGLKSDPRWSLGPQHAQQSANTDLLGKVKTDAVWLHEVIAYAKLLRWSQRWNQSARTTSAMGLAVSARHSLLTRPLPPTCRSSAT